jgi:hypothetical protein
MKKGAPSVVGRLPPALGMCRDCNRHVLPGTETCPHCGSEVAAAQAAYEERTKRLEDASARARALLERLSRSAAH